MKGFLAFPVLLILLFGTPASANFQKGLDAAKSGDYATALKEWKPLAEQGMAAAQYNLGLMYLEGLGVTQDYKAAFKWYKMAAEKGHTDAQSQLATMHFYGLSVTQDYKAALKWYTLAAEKGNVKAQIGLAVSVKPADPALRPMIHKYLHAGTTAGQGSDQESAVRLPVGFHVHDQLKIAEGFL